MKHPILLLLAAVVLLPFVVRPVIATEIWIFAIFGLGLNLLLGYTGLLSFGQSTFFGSAAYVAGWLLKHYAINVFFALGIGVGVGALSALLVGYLCVQRSGLYFIMLTFALNQLFYFIAYQWTSVTGGEDGMHGIPRPEFLGIDFSDPLNYYVFISLLFLALALDHEAHRGVAARQDPARRSARTRCAPRRSATTCRASSCSRSSSAAPSPAWRACSTPCSSASCRWKRSASSSPGNVVFATLIGGSGSLYGPIIGSIVFIWLSESISVIWARWPLLLGVAFVIVVLFFRGGVVEAWSRFWSWQSSRQRT